MSFDQSLIKSVMKKEFLLSYRKRSEYLYPTLFFLMVTTLFPLATPTNQKLLRLMGPGIIWVAVLLSILLSLRHLFSDDYSDGGLEQMILSNQSLSWLIAVKIFSQWLIFIGPLLILSPLLASLFNMSLYAIGILLFSLVLGTPILMALGSMGAALTVGLRNGSLLLVLLLLPLAVPTLIFASQSVLLATAGNSVAAPLAWLGALCILTNLLAPVICAWGLRMGIAYD